MTGFYVCSGECGPDVAGEPAVPADAQMMPANLLQGDGDGCYYDRSAKCRQVLPAACIGSKFPISLIYRIETDLVT